jgi:hypothetical protein
MSEIWRFTGNPENWLTAIGLGKWALNEHNKALWQNHIRAGDIALFHSTRNSDFSERAISAVIGFGYVGDDGGVKDDFWWVQEVRDQKNHWPYVVPLKELYLFSETDNIDFRTPVHKKPPSEVKVDIDRLIANGMTISSLNEQAFQLDPESPRFPINGSASRVHRVFEELILENRNDFFALDVQDTSLLETRLNESIDEKLSKLDKAAILGLAQSFDGTGSESHRITTGVKRVRKESQVQKRRIAALEDYTCQLCGFRCEYPKANGKKGWIIQVDHILEKSQAGSEDLVNLWVLCPNCHCKKTCGVIKIDADMKIITNDGKEVKVLRDNHLFW